MRYVLLLAAIWLLALPARATPRSPADTAALRINALPAAGLLLQKGWRYHAGDDPAWAQPGFDDSGWDTVTVARNGLPLPVRARAGAGWFRLRLRLVDSLRAQALALQLAEQSAGLEVYADGRRIGRSGIFSTLPARVRPVSRRGSLLNMDLVWSGPGPELLLAVRFAPYRPALPGRAWRVPSEHLMDFELRLCKQPQLRQQAEQAKIADSLSALKAGMFLLLCLLHVAFFRHNPAQRANAYFALYALLAVADYLLNVLYPPRLVLGGTSLVLSIVRYAVLYFGFIAGLRALYALFGMRPGWVYAGLCLLAGLLVPWQAYSNLLGAPPSSWPYLSVFVGTTLMQIRLTWQAVQRRQRGSLLVGSGFATGLLLVLAMVALDALFPQWASLDAYPLIYGALWTLAGLAPVLAISLYLAREFALDAQLLAVKLGEVERLSAQTLAQEQEKQALLAAQNETLETQVTQRTGELQRSLTNLRATQAQLLQKEKMASLGELTAGIAHEIQNPLNFVNNFSEVSAELMSELEEAQAAGDTGEVAALAADVRQNLGKITEHGRRAAGIVKGMLEHSRQSTGERAPTDLNPLCDEYLRLAYQGLRAKDKSFNAALTTDFAPDLPLVEAVGADVGRVLLNLFNNAFYAVRQRQQTGEAGYAPTVGVATERVNGHVEIRVSDNGPGMPAAVLAKIFQPFFTTKPTGEGTGLGLSLSHDIIAQGHGGTLRVESQEGRGTTFSVALPLNGAPH
ncbi:sensor histidine kinase [Hymenobacter convexus]|uniref:sensor histidine kinase n=1 Tax=Hymenobacter sp. CA1UV-4 TaxID=3063782 RepID=UPI0027128743|nr:ATP-binding protein [Hymenobacter sp. CA1UV-4]MDO7854050.1 ATP-binding protein [Hymenobacter sp. CA1UV-4]